MADRLMPVDITGEVLTRSTMPMMAGVGEQAGLMSGYARRRMTPERQPYFAVVDNGRADETVVRTVYPAWRRAGQCERGDIVRLRGYRWCRYARRVVVVRATAAAQAGAAST